MFPPIRFEGMTKRYGAVTVLDNVSIRLEPGRSHALMGENGAGKSTFIKLIAGVTPADSLRCLKGDAPVPISSASDAAAAGFRFIHQELNIVPQLSVAENVLLGRAVPARAGLFVNWRETAERARAALAQIGVTHIDPRSPAGGLETGDRMLVKLASALASDDGAAPCLYVLDEPTAALKEAEADRLFHVLDDLKQAGAAILYVSHRIAEIMRICDDVTVLRNGRHVSTRPIEATDKAQLVRDMTGKDVGDAVPPRLRAVGDRPAVTMTSVDTPRLRDLNFELAAGEILAVGGLAGAGQSELLRVFLGLEKIQSGAARMGDQAVPKTPSQAWARGVAYVPQERRAEGLMMQMGVRPNALLPHLKGVRARMASERRATLELARQVRLKANGPEQSVWQLSGGNQQKVVFARAMAGRPRLLLLDEPTRGVDVGARQEIYGLIRDLAAQGCTCIVASSDLPELLGLGDRIVILDAGRQVDLLPTRDLTSDALLNRLYTQNEGLADQ